MTTAAGEYTPLHLPRQFTALAIGDASAPFPLPTASTSPFPGGGPPEVIAGDAGAAALRKAWGSPPRRVPDHGEVPFTEELRSAGPVPSRGDRKKPSQGSAEGPLGIPFAAAAAAAVTVPSDSSQESIPSSIARSAAALAQVDPQQRKPRREKELGIWRADMQGGAVPVTAAATRTDLLPSKGNGNPRLPRPHLRPPVRQHQMRPPMQNGHRGRNPSHFLGSGGGVQQHRPRHQRNAGFFPHQQHAQVINGYGYPPAMLGLFNPTPEWGFNPSPNLQWGPKPQIAPPRMTLSAAPESMFVRGYFPGAYFPEGLSYCAPPFAPLLRPPAGQGSPWFMAPPTPPPPIESTVQNQPANPPLPPEDHQLLPEIAKDAENVSMRLRKQIEYYFSDENLVKDIYLRICMDDQGWIGVHTIASFPRVQSLTRDVGVILAALHTSPTVEVSDDRMRRKGEWSRWIIRRKPLSDASLGERRRDA